MEAAGEPAIRTWRTPAHAAAGWPGQASAVTSGKRFAPSSGQRNANAVEPYVDVVESYRDFAAYAGSDSPTFRDWAASLADNHRLCG